MASGGTEFWPGDRGTFPGGWLAATWFNQANRDACPRTFLTAQRLPLANAQ